MVDFALSDEQRALQELAHDFAEREIRPVAWELDRDSTFPLELIARAHGVGLMNLHIPEEFGGAGLGHLDAALIEEELSWGCSGVQTSLGANSLAMTPLLLAGSESLRRRYLERFAAVAGARLVLPDRARRRLGRRGDLNTRRPPRQRLRDQRVEVLHHQRRLRRRLRRLRQDRSGAGHRGISCFLVPRDAGVVVDGHEDKMGQRASNTSTVTFPDVEIPADHLIGEENAGFRIAMATLDRTRPGAAAMATGVARAAYEFAVSYARERIQFGVPIASHQAIQFMIADMATEIDAARLLTWRSAVAVDGGARATLESSHAKRFAADVAMRVTHRRRPGVRRLRLHQGLPRREADARREDPAALRGHRPDPAHRDRPRDLRAIQR